MIDGNKHHIGYGLGNHMINTQAYVIWVTWLLFGIGSFVAVARLTARKICGLPLGLEEYFVIFSLINWVTDVVAIPYLVLNGTNAMTAEMRKAMVPDSDEWIKRTAASKLFIFAWFTYLFMLWSLKASILLFYGRVTKGAREQKNVRYAWYALGVSMLACVIALFTVCRPFHKNWQIYPDPGRNCTDGIKYVWILGIFNIATDLMLLAIPLPIVLRLQTTPRRKIMLSILFGLGFFVIIATALRIHFTILGGDVQAMTFWCMIETCIAMIVANCPGLRVIFLHIRKTRKRARLVAAGFDGTSDDMENPSRSTMGIDSKDDHEYPSTNNQPQNSPHSPPGTSKSLSKWDQRATVVSIRRISGAPSGAGNLFNDRPHLDNDCDDGDGEGMRYNASSSDVELNSNYHHHISGCSRSTGSRSVNEGSSGGQSAGHRDEQEEKDDTIVDIIIDCEDSVVQVHPNPNTDRKHTPPILGLGICTPHIQDGSSNSKIPGTSSLPASVLPRGLFPPQNPFRRLLSRDRSLGHAHSRSVGVDGHGHGQQQEGEGDHGHGAAEKLSGRIVIHRTVTYGVSESVKVEDVEQGLGGGVPVPVGGKGTMGCAVAGEGGAGFSASSVVIGVGGGLAGGGGSGSGSGSGSGLGSGMSELQG